MSDRVLVIDENLNPRIARELRNRGRNGRAIEDIGLKGAGDTEILERVFALYDDPVLVTGDDSLPADHAAALKSANATVAIVASWEEPEATVAHWDGKVHRNEDEWDQEIVHRWAHIITLQGRGTVRRYRPNGYGKWTTRRRARSS
jgi:predicted nuclease of predicted toxin-antitoxin system